MSDETKEDTGDLIEEIWKDIPGYDGRYSVSNLGRVMGPVCRGSTWKRKILAPVKHDNGYRAVSLYKLRKIKIAKIHRLVLLAHVGPCPEGCEVNHIDYDRSNNRLSNLEWVTKKQNAQHSFSRQARGERSGARRHPEVRPRGEAHANSKLKEHDVIKIRELLVTEKCACSIARKFGVSNVTISSIRDRKTWKHLLNNNLEKSGV